MPRFMVLVKATEESERGALPTEALLAEMTAYNEALVKAGVLLDGQGLHPSKSGKRVRFSGKDRAVMDGPFSETKEIVAGYWLWECKSMDEAVEWVKRCPNPMSGPSGIEIRQLFGPDDFGEAMTPELRERHDAMARAEQANR